MGQGDGGEGVANIMATRNGQPAGKQNLAVEACVEVVAPLLAPQIFYSPVGVALQPESLHRASCRLGGAHGSRVVRIADQEPARMHAAGELRKGLGNLFY